jgi:hypothetical protein
LFEALAELTKIAPRQINFKDFVFASPFGATFWEKVAKEKSKHLGKSNGIATPCGLAMTGEKIE